MRDKLKTIIALILVILMVIGIAASITAPFASAEGKDLQQDLADLQKKREEMEKDLAKIENKIDSELDKKEIIDRQINSLQSEIDIANEQLDTATKELNVANEQLKQATTEYETAFDEAKKYIRSSYESGSVSYLEIILGSGSITDFITRVEIIRELTAQQNRVLSKLKENRDLIASSQKTILEKQQQQKSATNSLKNQKSTLDAKQKASDSLVQKFNKQSDKLIAEIEEAERLEKEMGEEIRRQLAQEGNGNMNVPVSDGFRYPLDAKWNIITSPFGYRTHPTTGVYKLHTGMDISGSGISGANIYASKNGSVSKAGYHKAYGNYAVINHGDNTATLYAHMSTLLVSAGDVVLQGDVIGKVGSTGYSTGAHLHFEIIVGGEYRDPAPYFSGIINFVYY